MPKSYEQLVPKDSLMEYCLNNLIIIPYVEMTVSAQCTLHCKDCANFMQYYDKPDPMNLENVLAWTNAFLDAVDYVKTFRVMGGEAMMQKQLPEVLKVILDSPKVEHMQLVTNSTIVPKLDVITLLKENNNKSSIYLSNYGEKLCPKYKMIVDKCLSEGIMVEARQCTNWRDFGDPSIPITNDIKEIKKIYKTCTNNCKHIWNGELHVCPRSAHGKALGIINVKKDHYVKLLETTIEERRRQIRALYDVDYLEACASCRILTAEKIPPGLQGETIKYKMVST